MLNSFFLEHPVLSTVCRAVILLVVLELYWARWSLGALKFRGNLDKLKKRYPQGFDTRKSINR